ncbi:MAG: hypothetical protein R2710_04955 [Acidimicrobiales bacterium]
MPRSRRAAGEALQAVVVDDVDNGRGRIGGARIQRPDRRRARPVLTAHRTNGARCRRTTGARSGRTNGARCWCIGAVPCPRHTVRRRTAARRFFADAIAVEGDWRAAVDTALEHPELTVVTRSGDRFASSGWRIGQAGTGATGAALDEARHEAETAARRAADATAQVNDARAELEEAKRQRRQLEEQLRVAKREFENATAAAERAKVEMERFPPIGSASRTSKPRSPPARIGIAANSTTSNCSSQALEADEAAHLDRTQQMGRLGRHSRTATVPCRRSAPTSRSRRPASPSAKRSCVAARARSSSDSNGSWSNANRLGSDAKLEVQLGVVQGFCPRTRRTWPPPRRLVGGARGRATGTVRGRQGRVAAPVGQAR